MWASHNMQRIEVEYLLRAEWERKWSAIETRRKNTRNQNGFAVLRHQWKSHNVWTSEVLFGRGHLWCPKPLRHCQSSSNDQEDRPQRRRRETWDHFDLFGLSTSIETGEAGGSDYTRGDSTALRRLFTDREWVLLWSAVRVSKYKQKNFDTKVIF